MAALLEEILELARNTQALPQEQRQRILAVAHKMNPTDLEKLKAFLLKIRDAEMADMKAKIAVYKNAAAAHQEWKADQARSQLVKNESADRAAEAEEVEHLLTF